MEKTLRSRTDLARLHATLWLCDTLVDDHVFASAGEEPLSPDLGFPGPPVSVAVHGGVMWVDGEPQPGGRYESTRGHARLRLELAPEASPARLRLPSIDWRLGVIAAAGVLLSSAVDVVSTVVSEEPELAARAAAVVLGSEVASQDPCEGERYEDVCSPGELGVVPDLSWRPPVTYQE